MNILVIGASGVAGTAAVRAVRERYGNDAFVAGLCHEAPAQGEPGPRIDTLVIGDVTEPATLAELREKAGRDFDLMFFATARGEVGFPIDEATGEQIAEADRVSFRPILDLNEQFTIRRSVGYSTFFTLRHQRINYGAMGHSKASLEDWVSRRKDLSRACIRAGAFPSPSSRAIKLLLRRNAKILAASPNPLLREFFDGAKPSEAVARLEAAIRDEERQEYGDTDTNAESLFEAHLVLLDNRNAMFVNVCGSRIWTSETPLRI